MQRECVSMFCSVWHQISPPRLLEPRKKSFELCVLGDSRGERAANKQVQLCTFPYTIMQGGMSFPSTQVSDYTQVSALCCAVYDTRSSPPACWSWEKSVKRCVVGGCKGEKAANRHVQLCMFPIKLHRGVCFSFPFTQIALSSPLCSVWHRFPAPCLLDLRKTMTNVCFRRL